MDNTPDRYAVIGHPVAHSQSPFIHGEFARETGQPMQYGRVECAPDRFETCVREFAGPGGPGQGRARGCNVTIPFKFEAARLAAQVSLRAALAQAANVLCFDREGWQADNTDGVGLVRDIQRNAHRALDGRRVLLIGAGGAAAGVLGPLIEQRPAMIVLANRTFERAFALAERHQALAHSHRVQLTASGLADCGEAFDVVLNSSASSVQGAAVPVGDRVLAGGSLAIDLMYGAAATPFLRWAEAQGAVARDGLGMLVEQAAEAFWLWRGVRPQTAPVLAALRARLAAGSSC
jgi:shikimate dehydrogenase